MSEENVEVARRSFEAWNEGGVEASLPTWSEDPEWHDPPTFPDADVHRGTDAVAARLAELRSVLPHRVEIEDAFPVGDHEVMLKLGFYGEGGGSGVPVEQPMGCIVRVNNGKIDRWRPFLSYADALDAAGLSE